ncbi:MAG TPA: EAL domain-containing protein, partial [Dermatophilaceae bacterium]
MTIPATILVVDDLRMNRRLIQALLEPQGYATRTASTGEEALASISDEPPDLILLDVMTPGLNGRQVAAAVKADPRTRNIPIIMVTAQSDREARLAALEAGAEDFLTKPLDQVELWLRVRNLLRLKELGEILRNQSLLEAEVQAQTAELRAQAANLHAQTAELRAQASDLQRFRTSLDATDDAIILVSRTTLRFVEVNATASQMFGFSREELLELGPLDLLATSKDRLEAQYDKVIAGQCRAQTIETMSRRDGSTFPAEVHRHAQREGVDWIIVAVMRDITKRAETEDRLEQLARFDPLTGLLNRTLFHETLTNTLATASATDQSVALLLLGLDDFKNVNDTHGLAVGDELLIQVGDRLSQCVRFRDTVGRLGGDEFALILPIPAVGPDAKAVASRIQTALLDPFRLTRQEVSVTASMGIAMYPGDAADTATLLRYADTALQQTKQGGRDAFQFFTSAMNAEVLARRDLQAALRQAVKKEEFVLYYQPQVEIAGGQVIGVEALLRWDRPGHGLVEPSEFIHALEETDLIVDVGRWVISAACAQVRDWTQRGIDPVRVAVNVSARQFVKGDLQKDVLGALEAWQVPARLLELELTETLLMSSTDATIATLTNLKSAGVCISIDDFGTGYSSLAYLRRFPIDKLKIDRSFICEVTHNPDDDAIVMAIIQMGHNLNLEVIAEGVETAPQLAYLRRQRCDQIQGY